MPSSAFGREMRPITNIGVNRAGRYRISSNVQLQGRYLAVVRTLIVLATAGRISLCRRYALGFYPVSTDGWVKSLKA